MSDSERSTLKRAIKSVNRSLIPKILLLSLVLFIGGIFVSHKIAGPIYRIERSAEAIRRGDLRVSFHIRRDDELKETTHVLDEMLESLRNDIARIKALTIALEDRIGAVTGRLNPEDAGRMSQTVKDIYAVLSKYKT